MFCLFVFVEGTAQVFVEAAVYFNLFSCLFFFVFTI